MCFCRRAGTSPRNIPRVTEINEAHQKFFNRPADPLVGPAYACLQILADALTRAKTLDRENFAPVRTKMTTVVGPVRFRADGTGEVKVFFQQWLKGKQELVWPKEFATAPFGYPAPPFDQNASYPCVSRVAPYGR